MTEPKKPLVSTLAVGDKLLLVKWDAYNYGRIKSQSDCVVAKIGRDWVHVQAGYSEFRLEKKDPGTDWALVFEKKTYETDRYATVFRTTQDLERFLQAEELWTELHRFAQPVRRPSSVSLEVLVDVLQILKGKKNDASE